MNREILMHAAVLDSPFGGTLCGQTEGWRSQIASDVTCPTCLADPRFVPPASHKRAER